ncbi:N-acetylgalactosamine-N,N'-diacetylbacillosaminyl-diphospho-undecaprenol 4-alpha-N-acetylgalactosaminyltransferase [Roseimaritima multifibrata]|uniref:N-acetylgalactosamine-N, N'-diacetylbacillosaminyl-diphospho-undecaprenol 4-alpha-N-acetylgalactosaminyltransferase n=1 Tax=Roseimaritima multifibrata TaxID=1930274 RepID=A0A517MFT8_9BACT|nr:glycosyltransferase [Roseimaritima multifibrata]QDS93753.1 N-acetylgalactosamine-N,N'-diacetylbacillosaminyl-diphospho-undecaprenol 4-alpha-N-acetylgalactosaminyltransferase [Roseimaritima multifibrata]
MSERISVLLMIGSLAGGGSERQMIGIAKMLDRTKFRPVLFLIYASGELLKEVPADVPVYAYWQDQKPFRFNYPGRILRDQKRYLEKVLRKESIDVLYSRTYPMALVAGPVTKRLGVPHLPTIVVDPASMLRDSKERWMRLKLLLLKRAYHDSELVLTVSEGVREAAIAFYDLPPPHVRRMINSLDLERLDRLAEQPFDHFRPGRFHIVHAGRFVSQKGHRYLFEAIAELVRRGHRELSVHLYGEGPDQDSLQQLVAKLGLQDHVELNPYLVNVLPAIKNADLFCLPSLYEGMPNALLEAVALGIPVVSTDCPSGPREILNEGELGRLVPVADSVAMADAIAEVIENKQAAFEWAARAKKEIRARFDPAAVTPVLEQILESAVGS